MLRDYEFRDASSCAALKNGDCTVSLAKWEVLSCPGSTVTGPNHAKVQNPPWDFTASVS